MNRILSWLILLCLAACSEKQSGPVSCLRLSFNTYPATLDPRKSGDFGSSTLICMIYEGLMRCLPDGSVELALADEMRVTADRKTYTFHLRDAFWSDGVKITAYDFEQSWKKILDPSFPSLCGYLLYPIKNAEAVAKGQLPLSSVGIQSLDAETLQVELEHPTPYFASLTAFPLFLPVPSHCEEVETGKICSGPFQVKKGALNAEIHLEKNPFFWNRAAVFLDEIQISIVADETTALQMFERGELDWIGGPLSPLPPDAIEALQQKAALRFLPSAASTLCTFNTQAFPFSNKSLRMAFSLAIDRDEIVEKITQSGQISATRILPPSLVNHQNKVLYPATDPAAAKKALAEGLEELQIAKSDLASLVLYFKPGQIDKRLALALQRQWKEVLELHVELQELDHKCHAVRLQKKDYQIALASWIAQFHDPVNILERFKDPENAKNFPGWNHASYQHLLEKAALTLDPDARIELLEQAEAIFAEEMPLTPLFHWVSPYLANPRIEKVLATPTGGILFEKFRL